MGWGFSKNEMRFYSFRIVRPCNHLKTFRNVQKHSKTKFSPPCMMQKFIQLHLNPEIQYIEKFMFYKEILLKISFGAQFCQYLCSGGDLSMGKHHSCWELERKFSFKTCLGSHYYVCIPIEHVLGTWTDRCLIAIEGVFFCVQKQKPSQPRNGLEL